MTGVDELVAFVRRCLDAQAVELDEDERVAREADSGRWLPEDKGITFEFRADDFHDGEAQARLMADTRANQWHIARWDPARVLERVEHDRRDIEAKRRILDLHPQRIWTPGGVATSYCEVCHMDDGVIWGDGGPCETIRLLAQPYAGQPEWQEEWCLTSGS